MKRNTRVTAALLAALCLVLLAAPFFIAMEARHDCCGEGCEICEQLAFLGGALRGVSYAILAAFLLCALALFAVGAISCSAFSGRADTLVSLRVKLSN